MDPPPPQDQGGVRGQAGKWTEEGGQMGTGPQWEVLSAAPTFAGGQGPPGQISCLCLSPRRRPFQGCGKDVLRRWGRRPHMG